MKPIIRKELYLNKIVGNNEYETPEKPITTEEFFFAEILGEAVQAPEPLTRYQMYLAKIAGREIEIPYPETRLEYFLARAAGMDVETPVPITREEIFWSNYTAIVEFELEGAPPLSFKAKAGMLKDYRIYGNTVDGESVGDRTGNLFDYETMSGISGKRLDSNGNEITDPQWAISGFIPCTGNAVTISEIGGGTPAICLYDENQNFITGKAYGTGSAVNKKSITITAEETAKFVRFSYCVTKIYPGAYDDLTEKMLNIGAEALPYEPYGYKVPVTVEGKNLWSGVVEQGAVSIIGNYEDGSKRIRSKNIPLEPGTYKLTSNLLVRMIFAYHDSTKFGNMFDVADGSENPSFTVPEGANNISVAMMKLVDGTQVDITPEDFEYGQIEKGSEATPYEPYHAPVTTPIYLPEQIRKVGDEAEYIDYGEQKQHRVRKNLLRNTATSQTINGVTFTVNNDGSVTCNGTATALIVFKVNVGLTLPVGEFILTGSPTGGGRSASYYLYVQTDNISPQKFYNDIGNGVTINNTSTDILYSTRIVIERGYSINNQTFYPMIRKAGIVDDTYEPYIENTEVDVILPALPTIKGTNVLSVGTAVQPSKVYVKYKGERQ